MKMHCTLQLCFALLLITLWLVSEATETKEDVVLSYENRTTVDESNEQEFKCGWNCKYMDSNLNDDMNWAFRKGKVLLRLAFLYEERMDPNCVNGTSQVLRTVSSTRWQIWLTNSKVPIIASKALEKISDLSFRKFNLSYRTFKANCTFNFSTFNSSQKRFSELSPRDYFKEIIRLTVAPLGNICKNETEQSYLHGNETCIMISEYTQDYFLPWMQNRIGFLFMIFFTFFGPVVVCAFSASEVTHQGIRQITVGGPSPVGFRRLIGNYFFSLENTFWHRMRKFIMRVILLPIPFLVPALCVEYLLYQNALPQQTSVKETTFLFRPFRMVCYVCYVSKALFFHFIIREPNPAVSVMYHPKSGREDEDFTWIYSRRELPERIHSHVYIVWLAVKIFSSLSWEITVSGCQELKNYFIDLLSCTMSLSSFSRFLCQTIFTSIGIFLLALYTMMVDLSILILSFPIVTLCNYANFSLWKDVNINFIHPYLLFSVRLVVVLLEICISCLAAMGVTFVLKSAAVGVIILLQLTFTSDLLKENLPFVSFCVVVSFYLWSNYRSFTQEYKDLAMKLFEQRTELNKGQGYHIENVRRIPKQLFDIACEEIMPFRYAVRKTLLNSFLSWIFVYFIYSLTMLIYSSHVTKAMVIFVAGSFPKMASILLRKRLGNIKAAGINERALGIVQEYNNTITITHPLSKSGDGLSVVASMPQTDCDCECALAILVTVCVISPCVVVSLL